MRHALFIVLLTFLVVINGHKAIEDEIEIPEELLDEDE